MITKQLKRLALQCGADLVGVADLKLLKGIHTCPSDLLEGYVTAVSAAVRLSDGVIDPIVDGPTPLYQQHYLKVNALLDHIAARIAQYLQNHGGKTLPLPASQVLDKTEWFSYLSHKAVAVAAGIGWQGKSLLVVSPKYGPRIRLVTILTDLPLEPDARLKNRCGKCSACSQACPVQAIKNVNTEWHFSDRDEALFFDRCAALLSREFPKRPFIESPICGVCIKACPWGKKEGLRRKRLAREEASKTVRVRRG